MKKIILLFFAAVLPLFFFTACDSKPADTRPVIHIKTKPEGANIFISGKPYGAAPLKGKIAPGTLLIRAELAGHETVWQSVDLQRGQKKEVLLELPQLSSSFMLKTAPAVSAEVTFNGKVIGQTPIVIPDLKPGNYTASLKAPGYAQTQVSWTIDSKRPQMKTVRLMENSGRIRVEKAPSKNAILRINGKNYGRLPQDIVLEQGEYDVEVKAPGFTVFTQKVSVQRGRQVLIRPVMSELPGQLVVTTEPKGAVVIVNGTRHGSTPIKIEGIKAGKVKIELRLNNYDPIILDQGVAPGQSLRLHRKMSSSLGALEFVTVPAGVTVYLDNKLLTQTVSDPGNKGYSKVFRQTGLRPGTYTLKFVHKMAKPRERKITVTIEKNKTTRIPGNVELWIPNARITLKVGSVYVGRIVSQNEKQITFEHKQGSRMDYGRNELRDIEWLAERE